MLTSETAMSMDFTPRHIWDSADWDRIAIELQKRFPDWKSHDFTMGDFEDAMETVITQQHQRTFSSMDDVRPNLFSAFARVSNGPRKTLVLPQKSPQKVLQTTTGAIRWTPDEWEQIVLELNRIFPTMFEQRCAILSIPNLRAAQAVLPLSRRREPNQIEIYRKQLLKTWDALPADVRDPRLQDRKIVDFPSGPIMEPIRQKSDASSAIAIAMHKGFQEPEKVKIAKPVKTVKVKQKRHSYDANDWLDIAREMRRQNPHAPYFTSAFQTVDLPALRDAQREVIPLERRRTIKGNFGLAAPLVAAFKALKEEEGAKVLEVYTQGPSPEPAVVPELPKAKSIIGEEIWREEQTPKILFRPALQEKEEPAPQPVMPVVTVQDIPPAAIPAPTDFLSRIIAASKPLINVIVSEFRQDIAQEVAKILLPQITGAIAPMLDASLQGVKEAIAAQFNPWSTSGLAQSALPISTPDYGPGAQDESMPVIAPPDKQIGIPAMEMPVLKPVEKPKKTKIAVIGPRGGQEEQVRRAFPEFDFVFIENGQGIAQAGESCALFIASNAYLNRANRDSVKAHVPKEKVRYIDGGISTIKRTINVWKATQTGNKNPTSAP